MKRFIKLTICIIYSAPPDWGIASQQMSGKKSNKFCITITLMCNQTGTKKLPIFYIRNSKQPRCFKKKKPSEYGFRYQNNKTAWMTAKYFEEWIKELNQEFQNAKWHVALTLDNFAGHKITWAHQHQAHLFWAQPHTLCSASQCQNYLKCEGTLSQGLLSLCSWFGWSGEVKYL